MKLRDYVDRLSATTDDPGDLFEHFERREAGDLSYRALSDGRHGVEQGTVVLPKQDAIVRGYPSIPRVLALEAGLQSQFADDAELVVEEKLDGFNVRVAAVDGELLAFTRSGYVCPFTTDRARALLEPDAFFEDHPQSMLCAELIGPETPYTTHDYDDVETNAFRVFDVRDRETGEPQPVRERRSICRRYGFPQPRRFEAGCDPATAVDAVRDAIAELDADGREGVVVETADATVTVKYTTPAQHRAELAYAFGRPFEYGRDFLFSRVVREAFQAADGEVDDEQRRQRARALGEAIVLPMVEAIHDVERGEVVGDRHTVRGDPETIDALLAHFDDQSVTVRVDADQQEDGERVVEFVKVAESTTDRVEYYLAGGTRDA